MILPTILVPSEFAASPDLSMWYRLGYMDGTDWLAPLNADELRHRQGDSAWLAYSAGYGAGRKSHVVSETRASEGNGGETAPTDITQLVHQIRVKFHLSQARLALLLRVSPETISNWEHGRTEPIERNRRALANLYERLARGENVQPDANGT